MAEDLPKTTAWYFIGFLEVANMAVSRIRSNLGPAPNEVRQAMTTIAEQLDVVGRWARKIASE